MNWNKKRVLVTGSRGFVGTALKQELLRQGAIVTGYDILDGLDVCDYDRLEYIASSSGAEIIYHLAAQSQVLVANDYPRHAIDTNIRGTLNVLNVARNLKTVQKTVIASTDKVYGEVGAVRDAVNESGAFLAKNPYDVSKACADMLANMYIDLYGMNVSISRSCNIYGYGDNNYTRLIPKTIQAVLAGKAPVIYGDGEQTREFVHIDDTVAGYMLLGNAPAGAYNFGGDETTVNGVVNSIVLMGAGKKPKHIGEEHHEIRNQRLDDRKAREVLGWSRTVSLDDGLKRTFDAYREDE